MDKKLTNVAVYVRKSREDETDDTLMRQQKVLTDLCVKNIWKYDLYKEVGSSQSIERPQLQAMLDSVKAFHYDAVVVADLDRLSRNTGHFGTIKEILINFGCVVVTPGKIYDFSVQEDDLFSDIQSVLAKNEYQTIKKRLIRGTRQSAKDGNWMGKRIPMGYNYNRDTKRLEPSEDAEIIKRIFEEYIGGLSSKAIAYKFTRENVTTSTQMVWTPSGISRLLNNPAYKGDSLFGKTKTKNGKRAIKTTKEEQILVENTHEAIIDKEVWEKAQEIKNDRNSRPIALKQGKHKYSGLIRCVLCGNVHSFQKSRGNKKRISSCQTRNYKEGSLDEYTICPNQGGNLDKFESIFFGLLSRYEVKIEKYIQIIKESEKPQKNSASVKLSSIERQLKKNDQEIKKVQQGFIMGIFTDDEAQEKVKSLKNQKQFLEGELENIENSKPVDQVSYLENVLSKIRLVLNGESELSEIEFNQILVKFIEAIPYFKIENKDTVVTIVWKEEFRELFEEI